MPLDISFLQAAQKAFDPHEASSGTEHMAFLLYSLVRMTRPECVVEYGSGYTTMFILRALADNIADIVVEKDLLQRKSAALLDLDASEGEISTAAITDDWVCSGDQASAVDPKFYLTPYEPRLFAFEQLAHDHAYAQSLRAAVQRLGHSDLFEHVCGDKFSASTFAKHDRQIDLAWNDADSYREFFTEFWPLLNPRGGLFIFHNVLSWRDWWTAIEWMKEMRSEAKDLEVLILPERHKLNQNSCAILRRTTEYQPPFALENRQAIALDLRDFMRCR